MRQELSIPDELKALWQLFATRRLVFPFAKHGLVPIINVAEEPALHLLATYNAEENTDIEWFSLQVCMVLEMFLCDHILLLGICVFGVLRAMSWQV